MTAPVVSFINMKGGVGKTTLCVGIAEYIANYMEKKVLVIDIDPQFNATQSLMGHYNRVDEYLASLQGHSNTIRKIFELPTSLMDDEKKLIPDEVITQLTDKLHLIPGDINIIFDTNQEGVRIKMLRKFILENNLKSQYDYIFIDSPPTISLFTDTALLASDYYVTPVKIDHYSVLGANSLNSVIRNMRTHHEKTIKHVGYVYTNTDTELTEKTQNIKDSFEESPNFIDFYFFESQLTYVRDLMVGNQGNIASCYSKSRNDIRNICEEFITRLDHLEGISNG
ncbi:ParA family protein [Citrobacter portucalensis]|uniref:ParA family protein n=1 Tax=Citrobacter freundii complex TaxID=1344959 RepID=UPI00200C37F3|nr:MULTISPECIES: ParA family protein [Citrobacter freundii complex]MCR3695690.1 ParA family protein [Citrobacter portucalensis]UQI38078.1 ParA family protein [Citrobacter freundii]